MRRSKYPVLWILSLLGLLVFGWIAVGDLSPNGQAFVNRSDAAQRAADFLRSQGLGVSGMIRTELYQGDTDMDAYLQRHELSEEFAENKLARPLSYWEVTHFTPRRDSYKVSIDETDGRVLGYEISRDEWADEPELTEEQALRLAREELERQGIDYSNVVTQELNGDEEGYWGESYVYKFRDMRWKVGESELVYTVGITGSHVSAFQSQYLIPKADRAWLKKQDSYGMILTGISLLGMFLFVVFSIVVAFVYPKHEVNWQRGLVLGLVLLGIALVSNLNEWPFFVASWLLPAAWPVEVNLWIIATVVCAIGVLSSGATYVTAVAGSALQNRLWPGKWLPWGDRAWPERIRSAAYRGYLLAFLWLGLQAIFYWISEKYFGVWQEADFTMTPWNYLVPGLFPVLAWTAGIGEEITFRLLGMSLLKRYLRSTFLALLIPAVVWALAHSLYPVHPFYTRFLELTLLGMLIGWCFLRYDLETVIFAHVIFDTVWMCLPLFIDGEWTDKVWAVGWMVLPALVGRYSRVLQPKWVGQQDVASSTGGSP
ncbi:type II CAAX prenyl endopeptidase Rce1 family protein [Effusibacillus consociatus]|uniref:Type II CAAX prenyl endopeptidase Rce1 family protein n=1 Tax=Effusibacillus consociatus TaxID=1117041 RepID=A0ABV9Q7Z5_9BACL